MRLFSNKRLIVAVLVGIWFELSVLPLFSIGHIKPDFFFLFLVFYAFRIHWKTIVGLAFLLGLAKDVLGISFFGLEAASHAAGAVLLQFLAVRLDRDRRWIQLASLFAFSLCVLILYSLMAWVVQSPYRLDRLMAVESFLIAGYTTAIGFGLFPVFEKWLRPTLAPRQYELF